jgi:hypothetical protein
LNLPISSFRRHASRLNVRSGVKSGSIDISEGRPLHFTVCPAKIRVSKTESRLAACLNRLLQQNLPKGGSEGCFDPNRSRAPTAIASRHQSAARRRTRSAPKKGRKMQDNQNSFTPWPSERICGQSW